MINMAALMKVLPISGLEPEWVALISGLIDAPKDQAWRYSLPFFEPPAGQRVPYIDPLAAVQLLLRRQGDSEEIAHARAQAVVSQMKASIDAHCWVNLFHLSEPESPECIPVSDFVTWLRLEKWVPSDITDFLSQAMDVTVSTPMFRGPDNWNSPWSLESLPALPPPKAMIEFVPGAPWFDDDWELENNPFLQWREGIRPVAEALETALGEPVYYFADLDNELDDDDVHRFLVLHWCCTYRPESAYVRYLLQETGASDVEELKTALIDPANYIQPFEMNATFFGMEVTFCRFEYLPPNVRKTVTIAFSTPESRDVAAIQLAQEIGVYANIIAPQDLVTHEWVEHATRYCRGWEVRYLYDMNPENPLETLALTDRFCVVSSGTGIDLSLSSSIQDLLWLASDLDIETTFFLTDRMRLSNPASSLQKSGAAERMALRKTWQSRFTQHLECLRVGNDYGSSGLWTVDGKMLGYDQLDLPFPLVRRIAAWQRDFDDIVTPPDKSNDLWWDRHRKEELEIAKALQDTLGPVITVSVWNKDGWTPISGFKM